MNVAVGLVPLLAVGIWAFVVSDWYHHCVNRRDYWLYVLLLTGFVGYYFFLNSPDR